MSIFFQPYLRVMTVSLSSSLAIINRISLYHLVVLVQVPESKLSMQDKTAFFF